ncbi:MAG: hypothetical protein JST40_00675 [Armatimonadetes bacterium]|nr:hypothetical protein [Armatimonadota bacterium]
MKLLEEFPPISTQEWMSVVEKDLKGQDFEKKLLKKSLDGVILKPFYRAEDLPSNLAELDHRGARQWNMREEIRDTEIASANEHALRALERGPEELAFYTFPIGPPVRTAEDMRNLLIDIYIDALPIHFLCGPLASATFGLFANEVRERNMNPASIRGSVDLDPITDRCAGWTKAHLDSWKKEFLLRVKEFDSELPNFGTWVVRGALFEKAGASLVQELSYSLALFADYLAAASEEFEPEKLAHLVGRSEIRLGVGTHYFLEIAKLRAIRVLIARVMEAAGIAGHGPKIHAVTTSSNKTLYDPHNNLLRGTIEAMAAAIAGADSLTVAAYDQGYHSPDEFSVHLARNTETLLKEEAHLGKVADPLAGSYTVERLTADLVDLAWESFLVIEDQGGFVESWRDGLIGSQLQVIRTKRNLLLSQRRRTIVGTTVYPNTQETRLDQVQPAPRSTKLRDLSETDLLQLSKVESLADLLTDEPLDSTPLDSYRPSWPFEHLRLRVERHAAKGGKRPKILLAKLGDLKMRQARAAFCGGFFGAGGYEIIEENFDALSQAAMKAMELNADALVLCSSDSEYQEFLKPLSLSIPILIAGNPVESLEELKAAGAKDFIHVKLEMLETLHRYHEMFGVPEIPLDEPLNPKAVKS